MATRKLLETGTKAYLQRNGRLFHQTLSLHKADAPCKPCPPCGPEKKKQNYIPDGYKKLKNLQAKFQQDDGLPIFLKGGTMDSILFRSTVVLALVGIGCTIQLIYELAKPH